MRFSPVSPKYLANSYTALSLKRQVKGHAGMRLETAEAAAAALNALDSDRNHSLRLGDIRLLFWAVDESSGKPVEADTSFISFLEYPDPLQVRDFFGSVWGHRPADVTGQFHVLSLTAGKARFKVRSWHSGFLAEAQCRIKRYFDVVQLRQHQERLPSIYQLCRSLRPETKDPRDKAEPIPHHPGALVEVALFGSGLPSSFLQSAVLRQQAEMAAFDPAAAKCEDRLSWRTSLLKLFFNFNRKDDSMNETNHNNPEHPPAYHCGRLLAVLDLIHQVAHGGHTGSSPGNTFYGSASRDPSRTFPRLLGFAQHHLKKIGNERKVAEKLEFGIPSDDPTKGLTGLAPLVALFNGDPWASFPRLLRLEEQGRFAIGFYYERCRCRYWRDKFLETM